MRINYQVELGAMTEITPSPFLQRCHMAFESTSDIFFVVDLVPAGDLFSHLVRSVKETGGGFSEFDSCLIVAEIVIGLEHMHNEGFVHRDLKVENVMLDGRGHVKLVDFGLAVRITEPEEPMSPTGSLIYMAPELSKNS